ncbi:uncharacterized protein LOC126977205 isoform X2 [Leptidea sinapis]|uniref:uncharacterized protein LOC126977205 isoform X2 n=1 Tax=Leptidea sinapis TaxID=189913 RepID=UPI0021C490F8|nr:uncharacterized protein LOC126977205 isoform X2 [Leptidea sinapis]
MFSLKRATIEDNETKKLIQNDKELSVSKIQSNRLSENFKRCIPRSWATKLYVTEKPFPNCLLKSIIGFLGGFALTYLCFIFFVFQLSISLLHATFMSSIIGVLLTLGLAFSNRIRCLVLLLIPQFFSRIGRYSLTCYALVLILTGPATNSLRNSEVLTESMACSQEQIKLSVRQVSDSVKNPFRVIKENVQSMLAKMNQVRAGVGVTLSRIKHLVHNIGDAIQSTFTWLREKANSCNKNLGTPYDHCINALKSGVPSCKKVLGPMYTWLCNISIAEPACGVAKRHETICVVEDFAESSFSATVRRKLRDFMQRIKDMLFVHIEFRNTYTISGNTSHAASQLAAGIVTEIRNRADSLLTWLSWSSCLASFFFLLIIFRAKYYQHMYETRSRYDNRYFTKEFYELDLKRLQEGRDTILPLSRRERTKYIPMSSLKLIPTEKVFLTRSVVFMMITTFKLLIHMIADYSLYWVLITIRQNGKYQPLTGPFDTIKVLGTGFPAELLKSIVNALTVPLYVSSTSSTNCLPNPFTPDFRRYIQIGVLIIMLWLFALFEPYGLRLRHVIMGHHNPERAKARANWLYNHILRTRASFMKLARRKLHREFKYRTEEHLTFTHWLDSHLPWRCLRYVLGTLPKEPHCLLCDITETELDAGTELNKCGTPSCPGIYCRSCFTDIGDLCTICMSPEEYGDYSDISLETGSTDDSSDESELIGDSSKDFLHLTIKDSARNRTRNTQQFDAKIPKQSKGNVNEETHSLTAYVNDNGCKRFNAIDKCHVGNKDSLYVVVNTLLECKGEPFHQKSKKSKQSCSINLSGKFSFNDLCLCKLKNFHKKRYNPHKNRRRNLEFSTQRPFCQLFTHFYNPNPQLVCFHGNLRKPKGNPNYFSKNSKFIRKLKFLNYRRTKFRRSLNKILSKTLRSKYKNTTNKFGCKHTSGECEKKNKKINKNKEVTEKENNVHCKDNSYSRKNTNTNKKKLSKKQFKIHKEDTLTNNDRNSTRTSTFACFKNLTSLFKNITLFTYTRNSYKKRDKNFKKRKKKVGIASKLYKNLTESESDRNYRISAYLSDCLWAKANKKDLINGIMIKDRLQDFNRTPESKVIINKSKNSFADSSDNANLDVKIRKKRSIKANFVTGILVKNSGLFRKKENPDSLLENKSVFKRKEVASDIPKALSLCFSVESKDEIKDNPDNLLIETHLNKSKNQFDNKAEDINNRMHKTDLDVSRRVDFYRALGNEFDSTDKSGLKIPVAKSCNEQKPMELKSQESHGKSSEKDAKSEEKSIHCSSSNTVHVNEKEIRRFAKILKSANILRSVRIAISEHFLHIRLKNPLPIIKETYALLTAAQNKNENKSKKYKGDAMKNLTKEAKKEVSDKAVKATPQVSSSSCQYNVNDIKQGTVSKPEVSTKKLTQQRRFDSDGKTIQKACPCYCSTRNCQIKCKPHKVCCISPSSRQDNTEDNSTTVCSVVVITHPKPRARRKVTKIKVNLVTKSSKATTTEKDGCHDISTATEDWWSPLVERKPLRIIDVGDTRRKRIRKKENKGMYTDRRIVKFLSKAQIIPSAGIEYVLSPSKYLLESQKYYNELFSTNLFVPHAFPLIIKSKDGEKFTAGRPKARKSRKTKRLDEPSRTKHFRTHSQNTRSQETTRSKSNVTHHQP